MTANKQSCANLHIPAKEVEQHWQMLRDMKRICEKLHSIVTTWHSVLKALYSSMHTEVNKSLMIQLSTLCQPESQKHLRSISEAAAAARAVILQEKSRCSFQGLQAARMQKPCLFKSRPFLGT